MRKSVELRCVAIALVPSLLVLFLGSAAEAAEESSLRVVEDKTLVAWVQLADLARRGGSVLTIIDPAERFDAIVFGERHTGRWMAGSDFFRRTRRDQAGWEWGQGKRRVKPAWSCE